MKSKMEKYKWVIATILVVAMVSLSLFTIGCAEKKEEAKEPIKIGVIVPLTGAPARAGKAMADAAKMAEEDINAKGGLLGRPVKIIIYDSEDKPETGKLVAERAILQDGVVALAGIFRSEVAMVVADVAAEYKVPLVVGTAQTPKLAQLVEQNYDKYKYVFRSTTNASFLGKPLTSFIIDYLGPKYGVKKVAFLTEDVLWARGLTAIETKNLEAHGFEVKSWLVPLGVTDIPEMKQMEEWGADVIFPVFSSDNGYLVTRIWSEQKIDAILLGVNNPIADPTAWEKTQGRCEYETTGFAAPVIKYPVTDQVIPWAKRFEEKYGPEGLNGAADTYEALQVIFQAIEKAGTTDADTLVKVLEENEFDVIRGKVKFSPKNHDHMAWLGPPYKTDSPLGGLVGQWQMVNGEPKIVVVWPQGIGNPDDWKPAPWLTIPRP